MRSSTGRPIPITMRRNSIKHIIFAYCRKLNHYGIILSEKYAAEDIHQFRLEYKKLHSFLRMLAFCKSKTKQKKISKKLITIYHLTGTIRELQLQQQWAKAVVKQNTTALKAYYLLLQHYINVLQEEFSSYDVKKIVAAYANRTTRMVPKKITVKNGVAFFDHQTAAVSKIVSHKKLTDTHFHTIRKYLKDLHYTFKFTGLDKEPPYFNLLLENLGRFHDACVALNLLQTSDLHELQKNAPLMQLLKKAGMAEKKKTKQILLRQLRQHFKN